jgi:methionyl-tRNA formyltransferase
MPKLRSLFFGTSDFAVPSLHVVAERTQLLGVVTQPDRPAGRGHKVQPTPVKRAALDLGLRVFEPLRLRPFAEEMASEMFDLFALASYGKMLPASLLDLPSLGALNVHPSLLPKYRGATPIQTALRNGDSETGVTIMMMDAGMDTGPLVMQESVEIAGDDDYGSLHDRLALYGGELLGNALDRAQSGELHTYPQEGEPSITYPIRDDDLVVDWSWSPQQIVNVIRAYAPAPAARAMLDGERVKLLRAHLDGDRAVIDELIAPNRGRMTFEAYERSRRDRADSLS